ncbi:hypothetical protein J5N97_020295 [Dioscorea zingiberensis]|uniref:Uncharacterized protein n=1 Tax=Dioscorea zingiberensis TaxID=325984 RepID=A0A9D5CFJ6_9LILI|nr:hypothetical protein J5N97_020295 [Dioscorea zingiberensis]
MEVDWAIRPRTMEEPSYRKRQNNTAKVVDQPSGLANVHDESANDPMGSIDPQVLEEHFQEVAFMSRSIESEEAKTTEKQPSHENDQPPTMSQVINTPEQSLHISSIANEGRVRREKIITRGGKKQDTTVVAPIVHAKGKAKEQLPLESEKGKTTTKKPIVGKKRKISPGGVGGSVAGRKTLKKY